MSKVVAIVVACSALTACGTYSLGRAFPQNGETQDQVRLAVLECQDRAKNEANTDGRVAASFVAGLTIVDAPIAIAEERRKTREVWQDCMKVKGYRVEAPDDAGAPKYAPAGPGKTNENMMTTQAVDVQKATPPKASAPVPAAMTATAPLAAAPAQIATVKDAPARDAAAQLEKLNELRAKGLITEAEYQEKRKTVLNAL